MSLTDVYITPAELEIQELGDFLVEEFGGAKGNETRPTQTAKRILLEQKRKIEKLEKVAENFNKVLCENE